VTQTETEAERAERARIYASDPEIKFFSHFTIEGLRNIAASRIKAGLAPSASLRKPASLSPQAQAPRESTIPEIIAEAQRTIAQSQALIAQDSSQRAQQAQQEQAQAKLDAAFGLVSGAELAAMNASPNIQTFGSRTPVKGS
jgi:hypothetical protein